MWRQLASNHTICNISSPQIQVLRASTSSDSDSEVEYDVAALLNDLQESTERERDLQHQLQLLEEEANVIRKNLALVEHEKEALDFELERWRFLKIFYKICLVSFGQPVRGGSRVAKEGPNYGSRSDQCIASRVYLVADCYRLLCGRQGITGSSIWTSLMRWPAGFECNLLSEFYWASSVSLASAIFVWFPNDKTVIVALIYQWVPVYLCQWPRCAYYNNNKETNQDGQNVINLFHEVQE